jgi:hypothetical protein
MAEHTKEMSMTAETSNAREPDVAMALHWIDRYAAGIDDECQIDLVADALGVTLPDGYAAAPPPAAAEPKTLPVPTRVYLTDKAAVIVGDPQRGWGEEGPEAHNCDDMGCATIGPHVLARVPFTDERALPQAAEAQLTYKGVPIGPMQTFADIERQATVLSDPRAAAEQAIAEALRRERMAPDDYAPMPDAPVPMPEEVRADMRQERDD